MAASLSSPPTFLLLSAPAPRLFPNSTGTPLAKPKSSTRKPPPLSCTAATSPFPSPSPTTTAAAAKVGSWRDLCSLNAWVVRDYHRLVASVNALEPPLRRLSDEQLKGKTDEFRARLGRGETLADVQAEAFSVVREAARRTLGMRHFDVQIIGGAVLHDGCIAEMKTGEGKTLVSTLAAYLNALTGEGVHCTYI